MKKKLRILLIVVAALVLVGVGIGLMMYYKPHKNFATSKVDVTIMARDLSAAFDADETNATWAYVKGDKTILVTGVIRDVSTTAEGGTEVVLAGSESTGSIACTLMPDQAEHARKLKKGETVGIRGQCTGSQELIEKQVILIRCAIAE